MRHLLERRVLFFGGKGGVGIEDAIERSPIVPGQGVDQRRFSAVHGGGLRRRAGGRLDGCHDDRDEQRSKGSHRVILARGRMR